MEIVGFIPITSFDVLQAVRKLDPATKEAASFHRSIVEEWTLTKNAQDIVDLFPENDCPAAFLYSVKQASEDAHIAGDRDMFPEIEYLRIGKLRVTGSHFKFSEFVINM
jgi:crotonobetainyl-CoA:carnitine CoA-transferase CaiB-like acyl-CoA transferase